MRERITPTRINGCVRMQLCACNDAHKYQVCVCVCAAFPLAMLEETKMASFVNVSIRRNIGAIFLAISVVISSCKTWQTFD